MLKKCFAPIYIILVVSLICLFPSSATAQISEEAYRQVLVTPICLKAVRLPWIYL